MGSPRRCRRHGSPVTRPGTRQQARRRPDGAGMFGTAIESACGRSTRQRRCFGGAAELAGTRGVAGRIRARARSPPSAGPRGASPRRIDWNSAPDRLVAGGRPRGSLEAVARRHHPDGLRPCRSSVERAREISWVIQVVLGGRAASAASTRGRNCTASRIERAIVGTHEPIRPFAEGGRLPHCCGHGENGGLARVRRATRRRRCSLPIWSGSGRPFPLRPPAGASRSIEVGSGPSQRGRSRRARSRGRDEPRAAASISWSASAAARAGKALIPFSSSDFTDRAPVGYVVAGFAARALGHLRFYYMRRDAWSRVMFRFACEGPVVARAWRDDPALPRAVRRLCAVGAAARHVARCA